MNKLERNEDIRIDVLLSEEGGRFYHEQNRNVIMEIDKNDVEISEEDGYFWCDYATLNTLVQVNNTLNIQLRNVLSLLEV
jgi:oxidase EvaA